MADPNSEYLSKLRELTDQTIDQQTKAFLRAFVGEFQGKFEKVLDLVEEFRTFTTPNGDGQVRSLFVDTNRISVSF